VKKQYEIMVLDDEEIVCENLEKYFKKKDFIVEAFTESQKALDRLKEKKFDVVITDLKMAGPDGIDVLVYLKSQDTDTQVIIITGYADMESRLAAEYKNAFSYLLKPFKMDELERLVMKAAKKSR